MSGFFWGSTEEVKQGWTDYNYSRTGCYAWKTRETYGESCCRDKKTNF